MDRWSPRELREMLEEQRKRKRGEAAREERKLGIEEKESRERFAPGGLEERKYLKGAETTLAGTKAYETRTAGMYGPEGYYTKGAEREEAKLPFELKDLLRGEKLSEVLFPQRVAKAGYEAEAIREAFEKKKKAAAPKERTIQEMILEGGKEREPRGAGRYFGRDILKELKEKPTTLTELPEWIRKRIKLPEEMGKELLEKMWSF